jgi:hypothetical protein
LENEEGAGATATVTEHHEFTARVNKAGKQKDEVDFEKPDEDLSSWGRFGRNLRDPEDRVNGEVCDGTKGL